MKTSLTKASDIKRSWVLVDLADQTLGRASTDIAIQLMGKNKTYFTPNLDCGDYVVVINAAKVHVTGNKTEDKIYRHHSGYPGGFKEYTFDQVQKKDATRIIESSVKGMLPKNKLRSARMKRLKIFVDDKHPYETKFNSKIKE